mmetsp:Transcript_41163/g.48071  ORF Transcript_41163/g.48071 Transcript_41163/m.48071 type:complete len:85 (-) Transcript_41163:59-313(-)
MLIADSTVTHQWASSLPLPENIINPAIAEQSILAMTCTNPISLVSRPKVDLYGLEGRHLSPARAKIRAAAIFSEKANLTTLASP